MTYANWFGIVAHPFLIFGIIGYSHDFMETGFIFLIIAIILLTIRDTIFAQKIRELTNSEEIEKC